MSSKFFKHPDDSSSSSSESGSDNGATSEDKTANSDEEEESSSSNADLAAIASRLFNKSRPVPSSSSNSSAASVPPNALVPVLNGFESSSSGEGAPRRAVRTREVLPLLTLDLFLSTLPIENRQDFKKFFCDLLRISNLLSPQYNSPLYQNCLSFLARKISGPWISFIRKLPPVVDESTALADQLGRPIGHLSLKMPTSFEKMASRYEEDFEEVKAIGMGGFGKVYHCRSRVDKQNYAVKRIPLKKADKETCEKMLGECRYHAQFQHPNVVRYHNAWLEFDMCPASSPERGNFKKLSTTSARPFANSDVVFLHEDSLKAPTVSGSSIQFQETQSSGEGGDAECIVSTPGTPKSRRWTDESDDFDDEHDEDDSDSGGSGNDIDSDESLDSSSARRKGKQLARIPIIDKVAPQLADLFSQPDHTVIFQCPVLYIQMELCHRTLDNYLTLLTNDTNAAIDINFNEKVVDSLLSAVAFLHRKEVIHRDIKPSNVFIKNQDGHDTILLGDFGLARNIQELCLPETSTPSTDSPASSKLTSGLGTYLYAAPEQLSSNSYTLSVDIYSAGVLIYEMYHKFGTKTERGVTLKALRSQCAPSDSFKKQWPKLAPIIHSMVSKSADRRPSANDLLSKFKLSRAQDSEVDVLRTENAKLKEKLAEYESKIAYLEKQLLAHARGDSVDSVDETSH